jgi:hypothetical protein
MNILALQVMAIIALTLMILSLFGLENWVVKFITATITLAYFGFMLGVGFYLATLFVQMVTL